MSKLMSKSCLKIEKTYNFDQYITCTKCSAQRPQATFESNSWTACENVLFGSTF